MEAEGDLYLHGHRTRYYHISTSMVRSRHLQPILNLSNQKGKISTSTIANSSDRWRWNEVKSTIEEFWRFWTFKTNLKLLQQFFIMLWVSQLIFHLLLQIRYKLSPSLKAQSFDIMVLAIPTFLKKPRIQLPLLSLVIISCHWWAQVVKDWVIMLSSRIFSNKYILKTWVQKK